MRGKTVTVNDKMQRGYRYILTAPPGRNFDPEFDPELTPAEMLRLGVFGGKYMTDCAKEFPRSWFGSAKLAGKRRDSSLNYFGVDASQPLSVWRKKGVDSSGRSARLVSVVLPLLRWPPDARRRRPADQALEGHPPPRAANPAPLRAR